MFLDLKISPNQEVVYKIEGYPELKFWIKRDDLLHKHISGNKYRKLRYNLQFAHEQGFKTLLTFGGAYSNHIAAAAAAGYEFGFETIGIIRGDELQYDEHLFENNPTMKFAKSCGMRFKFVSRADYRLKETSEFVAQLHREFGAFYYVPQGGTNVWAVKGCEEILTDEDQKFDYITCAIGTGGTISGIINSVKSHQMVLGFPALKDDFLENEIKKYIVNDRWKLIKDFHFGGFAKINAELVQFMNDFYSQTNIVLDPIYTGKMIYGMVAMHKKNYFPPNAKILAIHTGGLQGIDGMNSKLKSKNLELVQ